MTRMTKEREAEIRDSCKELVWILLGENEWGDPVKGGVIDNIKIELLTELDAVRKERDAALLIADDHAMGRLQLREKLNETTKERDGLFLEVGKFADVPSFEYWKYRAEKAEKQVDILIPALHLIAVPVRTDGTYNRDRAACGALARSAIFEVTRLYEPSEQVVEE